MSRKTALKVVRAGVFFCFVPFLILMCSHASADEMTFDLVQGFNGISIPFENTGLTDAEQLCQSIPNCDSVSYWDAKTQSFITHALGSPENNFLLQAGFPYFVNLTQGAIWTISGDLPQSVTFNLVITDGTDVNVIVLPQNMSHISSAEYLANSFLYIDTVWYWDNARQGFVGHPKGTGINNFEVVPGRPYFVNVTADTILKMDVALRSTLSILPTRGPVPLEVQFSAAAAGGVPPYQYAWDINGDGLIDDTRERFSHIYTECGFYSATLKVTDAEPVPPLPTL